MPECSQGVCGDGAVILRDGQPVTIDEVVACLTAMEAALHKINALIDSPARFNKEVQDVLDSVIDTSDTKFSQ